jgi:plasmid stabilization system protein ParE
MVKKIKWNNAAENTFEETTNYLQDNFSSKAAENFANLVYDRIDMLVHGLTVGRKSDKAKTVMVLKLDKHRQMYYRIHGTTLIIVDFWDTRQDPRKKPY